MFNHFRYFLLSMLLAAAPLTMAGPGVWTSTGPEGGTIHELVVDPAQPSTIFLRTRSGIYRSTDTGATWTALTVAPYAAGLGSLRMSPHDPDVLLVTSGLQIFRTTDGGSDWQPLTGGLPAAGSFSELRFDPINPGRVWAVGTGRVWRSDDNGGSWTDLAATGLPNWVSQLRADPHVADRLMAYGDGAVYRSTDGGHTWSPVTGLPSLWNAAISFTATTGKVLVGTYDNMHQSTDGGASFSLIGPVGLPHADDIRHIHPHADNSDVWWLGLRSGLVRTDDAGATYTVVGQGIGPVTGGDYGNGVNQIFVRPDAPGTIYAGADFTGFHVSHDAGITWARRNTGLDQIPIRALAVHPQQPLWVYAGFGDAVESPSDGLFRSVDRSASWSSTSPSLEATGLRSLLIDPNTSADPFSTTVYAAGYASPIFSLSGAVRDGNGGIFKSIDGGTTWSTIDTGIPYTYDWGPRRSYFGVSRSVIADPASGAGSGGTGPLQTLYLGGSGTIHYAVDGTPTVRAARIYKSTDAGANWNASDTGLPIPLNDSTDTEFNTVQVVALAIDPDNPAILYAGTTSVGGYIPDVSNPRVSRGVINGVFKSTDAGATWVHSSNGLPRMNPDDPDSAIRSVLALALAPSQPSRLYATATNDLWDAIIHRSDDGGATWIEASAGIAPDADIRALIVDPDNADVAYAGSVGGPDNPGGVYRTIDGGVTWTSYSIGLPSNAALALHLDVSGTVARLYAGTLNGVFSIDQVPDEDNDGVPSAIETAAPYGGDGNGDGIPDTLQANVASLLAATDGLRGDDSYITVEVQPVGDGCERLENTHILQAAAFPADPHHSYPFGLVRMDLPGCTATKLHLRFHGGEFDPAWRFRTYAPLTPDQPHTYAWRDLPFSRDGDTWTVTVTDNQLGDLRAGDNAILFQGGVALADIIFADGFD